MNSLFLKKGRERSVKRRHPWVFSGAIEKVAGDARPGETVQVRDIAGNPLALAAFSPKSQIRAPAGILNTGKEFMQRFFAGGLRARSRCARACRPQGTPTPCAW